LRRLPLRLLMLGALLFVVYHVLKAFEVGKIGAPSDIGGGLILLLAYGLLAVGVVGLLVAFRRGRGG